MMTVDMANLAQARVSAQDFSRQRSIESRHVPGVAGV